MRKTLLIIILMLFSLFLFQAGNICSQEWQPFHLYLEKPEARYLCPEVCDIDLDGDMDIFFGTGDGFICFYENTGTPGKYSFEQKNRGTTAMNSYFRISVPDKAVPRFVDIDNDNDLDLFIGNNSGNIAFYKNEGSVNKPSFIMINSGKHSTNSYFNINVGLSSAPFFIDIDQDNDYDLFIGNANGYLAFYRNDGTPSAAVFNMIVSGTSRLDSFADIDAGEYAVPCFCDLDGDGKQELLTGNYNGQVYCYRNTGSLKKPKFKLTSKKYADISMEGDAALCLADLNNDAMDELFAADNKGGFFSYRQAGSLKVSELDNNSFSPEPAVKTEPEESLAESDTGQEEFLVRKAEEQISRKDFIEAKILLDRVKGKSKEIKKIKETCENGIKKLISRAGEDSLIFREVEDSFKKGINDYIAGKYGNSASSFKKVLAVVQDHRISREYMKRAEEKLKLADQKKEAKDSRQKAAADYEKGRIEQAFTRIKRSVQLDPDNFEYYSLYTQYSNERAAREDRDFYNRNIPIVEELMKQKKYNDSLDILLTLQAKFPQDERVDSLVKACMKESSALQNEYNLKMRKKFMDTGDGAYKQLDLKKALDSYLMARKYSPADKALDEKIQKTREDIEKKERGALSPDLVNQYFREGLKYYSMGLYAEAINEWEKVLRLNPKHIMAEKNIKKARELLGK
ncbi:MAG: FG-GAP-like repeat-containing protein [bacterium]|nr:FG-GAP-like repeat-containing protein [bacterium]